jgi:hypothetical protein
MPSMAETYRGQIVRIDSDKPPQMRIVFQDKSELVFELTAKRQSVKPKDGPNSLASHFSDDMSSFSIHFQEKLFTAFFKDGSDFPLDLNQAEII